MARAAIAKGYHSEERGPPQGAYTDLSSLGLPGLFFDEREEPAIAKTIHI